MKLSDDDGEGRKYLSRCAANAIGSCKVSRHGAIDPVSVRRNLSFKIEGLLVLKACQRFEVQNAPALL